MARLAYAALCAFEEGRLADVKGLMIEQKQFADGHMNNWLQDYAQGLLDSKKAPLYGRLAKYLAAFTQVDSVFANEVIHWIDECVSSDGVENVSEDFDQSGVGMACFVKHTLQSETCFDEARSMLARLQDLRLKNLEDNELCNVGNE